MARIVFMSSRSARARTTGKRVATLLDLPADYDCAHPAGVQRQLPAAILQQATDLCGSLRWNHAHAVSSQAVRRLTSYGDAGWIPQFAWDRAGTGCCGRRASLPGLRVDQACVMRDRAASSRGWSPCVDRPIPFGIGDQVGRGGEPATEALACGYQGPCSGRPGGAARPPPRALIGR
jgi:hypothetical protein